MPKISGLIFSADPIKETLATAKHLLEFTDEVVIVYSGTPAESKRLKLNAHTERIHVFHLIRTGYPEPFRHYGIMLCKYNNIAMLDVDERFSDTKSAKELFDSNKADVYLLWRHELTEGRQPSKLYTKQYRLFKKGALEWKGLLHETPRASGRKITISRDKLYIIHKTGKVKSWNYDKLNEVFPVERPIKMAIRDAYVERGFKHLSLRETLDMLIKRYRKHKADADSMDMGRKEIVRHLRKEGTVNYLNLDNKKTVEMMNSKYEDSEDKGIDLLIKMLYDRNMRDKSKR